jgi:long-chain acyl-CoA synthetase
MPDGGAKVAAKPDDPGLSSLERVELQVRLEHQPEAARASQVPLMAPIEFPEWSRGLLPRALRRVALPYFLLPLARIFAHVKAIGRERLKDVRGPVIFAANHQSHLDNPAILAAMPSRFRYRVATAMSREFFHVYFHPEGQPIRKRFRYGLEYYLACLCFNAFPLPQREAGARESLRYMGELASDGWSILIFPEGAMTLTGEIAAFQPGVGLIAAKTGLPVVPVRIIGLDKVLHKSARFPTPGPVEVRFGDPIRFTDEDYGALDYAALDYTAIAKRLEDAVRSL